MNKSELTKVERYMRKTFSNHSIRIVARPRKDDSAEVFVGDEFIGVLFLDDDDGESLVQLPDGDPGRGPRGLTRLRCVAGH